MNLHELFEKFETAFLAGHEKIKTGLDLELFTKHTLLRLAVIDETIDDRRITYAVEYC